jgi:hypothetical protein
MLGMLLKLPIVRFISFLLADKMGLEVQFRARAEREAGGTR